MYGVELEAGQILNASLVLVRFAYHLDFSPQRRGHRLEAAMQSFEEALRAEATRAFGSQGHSAFPQDTTLHSQTCS